MIFYHSGCGNSKHVAEIIHEALNERLVFIPQAEREKEYDYELSNDERVGFVFPVYAWGPPKLVQDFVDKLHFNKKPEYVYFIVTCGDNVGYTQNVFYKTLKKNGLDLTAAFCVRMPNTYILMPGMKLDSKEVAQKKLEETAQKMPKIIDAIQNRQSVFNMIPGGIPFIKTYLIRPGFNKNASDKGYHTTDACISCGKCVEVCPLKNITLENGKPAWHSHCITCMACYQYCPTNAIQYGKITLGKGQYYFNKDMN